jgi:hypothetical protein
MVPVADEVDLADLDQLDRRQAATAQVGFGDTQPAILGVCFERVKRRVEILTVPLTAANLLDGHDPCSRGTAITDRAGGSHRREVKELVLLAAQLGPDLARPASAAGGCVQVVISEAAYQ